MNNTDLRTSTGDRSGPDTIDAAATNVQTTPEVSELGRFQAALEATIDVRFAELMKNKQSADRFLAWPDAQIIITDVRSVFKHAIGVCPPQIEAACNLSEAVLAPSAAIRRNLIKATIGIAGGATGTAMLIGAIGTALGWGAGVAASVAAFFVGTSLAGPLGWGVFGLTLAGAAAYFAATSNRERDTERFMKVLKAAVKEAVDACWSDHSAALSSSMHQRERR